MDRQTDGQTDGWTTDGWTDSQTERKKNRWIGIQMDRQTNGQKLKI
jgi:hypothetical protein